MRRERLERMGRVFLGALMAVVLAAVALPISARAAEPPALQGLSGAERERVAKLIEGARKEGDFMFLSHSMNPEVFQVMAKAFRKHYGLPHLKMRHALMRTHAFIARVRKELMARRYLNDVLHIGAPLLFNDLIKRGELARYVSPEYKHYDPEVTSGKGAAAAMPGYYISGMISYFGIVYNSKFVKEIKSWEDLLDPKYKGKIIVQDASKSSTTGVTYVGMRTFLPRSYWEKLRKQNPIHILSNRSILNRIVAGEYWISTFVTSRLVYKEVKRGNTFVKAVHPGRRQVAIGYQMAILKRAPHPNAARLWVDFFHSKKGQEILVPLMGYAPARKDLKVPALVRKFSPPTHEMNLIRIDWPNFGPKQLKKYQSEFREIFFGKAR